jgi:hypothetical protein
MGGALFVGGAGEGGLNMRENISERMPMPNSTNLVWGTTAAQSVSILTHFSRYRNRILGRSLPVFCEITVFSLTRNEITAILHHLLSSGTSGGSCGHIRKRQQADTDSLDAHRAGFVLHRRRPFSSISDTAYPAFL